MNKTFLVKKNPELPLSEDNWLVMNSYEFAMFMKTPEGKKRRKGFGRLDGVDSPNEMIIAECGVELARVLRNECLRHKRLKKAEIESGIITVSLDEQTIGDEGKERKEFLIDETIDIENDFIHQYELERLRLALTRLNEDDYDLIFQTVMSDEKMTLTAYSKLKGIPYRTLLSRRKRIMAELKSFIEKNPNTVS